jgi:hypothetical protein
MTTPAVTRARPWLDVRSPLHQELDWLWEQNERRYEGGHRVWPELWRFDWESAGPANGRSDPAVLRDVHVVPPRSTRTKDVWSDFAPLAFGEHYARRQEAAIYVNFMEAMATDTVGMLFKQAPAPDNGLDFGRAGKVRRKEDIDEPTLAELIYYNTDGVGVDGSQWDMFWSAQLKLAMVTGYRWMFVEVPSTAARNQGQQRRGLRPYVVPFSPREVVNHHYENGVGQWFNIKIGARKPRVVDGKFEGNDPVEETLLLVRQGNADLGREYVEGGWWRYDKDNQQIGHGTWGKTEGEIPMAPLFYDRHPSMFGRPGLTELGNAGVAAMNLHSCADFDAFDSSGSVKALRGVDRKGFNLFIDKVLGGNRYAPLPTNEETSKIPDVTEATGGSIVADVFEKRLLAIARAVDRIKGSEVNSAPQASGLAQQAGFTMGNVPRLALVAGNLETCQNAVINWLEQRAGKRKPSGSVRWTKKFELIKLTSSAQALLQLEAIAGISSEDLDTRVILASAQDEGFVPDNATATKIDSELRASHQKKIAQAEAVVAAKTRPQVPGARKRAAPPEPAETNQPIKDQLDGPNIP